MVFLFIGSNRLPPIPHCEAPSWQKPITNFFNSDAGSSKNDTLEISKNDNKEESSRGTENEDISLDTEALENTKEVTLNNSNSDDEPLLKKQRKEDKTDTEKLNENSEINSIKLVQNNDEECDSEKQSTNTINEMSNEKTKGLIKKNKSHENSFTDDEQLLEKRRKVEENGKENVDGNTNN